MDIKELDERLRWREGCSGPWMLAPSPLAGRGAFATADIHPGDKIFIDTPILIGPRVKGEAICVMCLRGEVRVEGCVCGVALCGSRACGEGHGGECLQLRARGAALRAPSSCSSALCSALTPLRALYTLARDDLLILHSMQANPGDEHRQEERRETRSTYEGGGLQVVLAKKELQLSPQEEELLGVACRVLDSVAFEVVTGPGGRSGHARGLYPLAAMLNHSCCPNTRHSFTLLPGRSECGTLRYGMLVAATRAIAQGEELTTNYCPLLWGTIPRRMYLAQTKHFDCTCPRCSDPTEFGTYFSSIECETCGDRMVASEPLVVGGGSWVCRGCGGRAGARRAATALARAHLLPAPVSSFLSQLSVRQYLQAVWKMSDDPGLITGMKGKELSSCADGLRKLLGLLQELQLGMCHIRGCLLLQYYLLLTEMQKRNMWTDIEAKNEIIMEAIVILRDDITAPKEFNELLSQKNFKGDNNTE